MPVQIQGGIKYPERKSLADAFAEDMSLRTLVLKQRESKRNMQLAEEQQPYVIQKLQAETAAARSLEQERLAAIQRGDEKAKLEIEDAQEKKFTEIMATSADQNSYQLNLQLAAEKGYIPTEHFQRMAQVKFTPEMQARFQQLAVGPAKYAELNKPPELPASVQEYQFAQQNPEYVKFMEGRRERQPVPGTDIPYPPDVAAQRKELRTSSVRDEIKQSAAEARVASMEADFDRLKDVATELKGHPGMRGAVGFRLGTQFIPGTAAASFKAKLDTLRSQIAFGALNKMREASKTGGALGNVSNVELQLLQNNVAALDENLSESEFVNSLDSIIKYAEDAKSRLRATLQGGGAQEQPPQNTPRPVFAVNPQTKQRIMSTDGGQTWQPAQ